MKRKPKIGNVYMLKNECGTYLVCVTFFLVDPYLTDANWWCAYGQVIDSEEGSYNDGHWWLDIGSDAQLVEAA